MSRAAAAAITQRGHSTLEGPARTSYNPDRLISVRILPRFGGVGHETARLGRGGVVPGMGGAREGALPVRPHLAGRGRRPRRRGLLQRTGPGGRRPLHWQGRPDAALVATDAGHVYAARGARGPRPPA